MNNFLVSISYAHEPKSIAIAKELCEKIPENFDVFVDKRKIRHGGYISEYIKTFGDKPITFIIISKKYIKSLYCMQELLRVYNLNDGSLSDFRMSVITIWAERIRLDRAIDRAEYIKFWQDEKNSIDDAFTEVGKFSIGKADKDEWLAIQEIGSRVSELVYLLSDIFTPSDTLGSGVDAAIHLLLERTSG